MQKAVVRTKIPTAEPIRRHVQAVEVKIPAAEQTLSIATIRASRVRRWGSMCRLLERMWQRTWRALPAPAYRSIRASTKATPPCIKLIDSNGRWRGESSLQAERLEVYWNSQGNNNNNNNSKHPADQEQLLKVGTGEWHYSLIKMVMFVRGTNN